MKQENDINRFLKPQEVWYDQALKEIRQGKKINHWIWFIFPQLRGLGQSYYSWFYGISSSREAKEYLEHPILGKRLREAVNILLELKGKDPDIKANRVFSYIDAIKLRSSMTLFDAVSPNDIFSVVIEEYYNGERDEKTLRMILKEKQSTITETKREKEYKEFTNEKDTELQQIPESLRINYTPKGGINYGDGNINSNSNITAFLESVKDLWNKNKGNISVWINDILLNLYIEDDKFHKDLLHTTKENITLKSVGLDKLPQELGETYLYHLRAFRELAIKVKAASTEEYKYLQEHCEEEYLQLTPERSIHTNDLLKRAVNLIEKLRMQD